VEGHPDVFHPCVGRVGTAYAGFETEEFGLPPCIFGGVDIADGAVAAIEADARPI